MQELFRNQKGFTPLNLNLVGDVGYYVIVSRQLPDAQRWVERFNAGLKHIKSNGTYQRILAARMKK